MSSTSTRYRFTVPPTADVGSYSGTCSGSCSGSYGETYRQNALWDYNRTRAHDGLPPVARMPKGTKYTRIKAAKSSLGAAIVDEAIRGLREYHAALDSSETRRRLAAHLAAFYRDSGNQQSDYERLRDEAECWIVANTAREGVSP